MAFIQGCALFQAPRFPDDAQQRRSFSQAISQAPEIRTQFDVALSKSVGVFVGPECDQVYSDGEMFRAAPGRKHAVVMGIGASILDGTYVISANHLFESGEEVCIVGRGDNEVFRSAASVVWCSERLDLAILQLDVHFPTFFSWSDSMELNDPVWTIGRQAPVGGTLDWIPDTDADKSPFIWTSLPLTFGDSGSPLIDSDGYLVGTNVLSASESLWSADITRSAAARPPQIVRSGNFQLVCDAT